MIFFDCIISDIPYKINTSGVRVSEESIAKYSKTDPKGIFNRIVTNNKIKNKWLKQEDINDNAILIGKGKFFKNIPKFNEYLPDLYRVLKPQTHCYLMVNARNLKELQTEAEKASFKFQNLLVWIKNNQTPNKFFMQKAEYILMLRKGKERYINNLGSSNIFTYPNIIGNKYHPTEKPVELMKELIINSTNEGDKILDPFMGSGSTCIAAKQTNREYFGIEIEEKYFNIAKKRINEEPISRGAKRKQLKLFENES